MGDNLGNGASCVDTNLHVSLLPATVSPPLPPPPGGESHYHFTPPPPLNFAAEHHVPSGPYIGRGGHYGDMEQYMGGHTDHDEVDERMAVDLVPKTYIEKGENMHIFCYSVVLL